MPERKLSTRDKRLARIAQLEAQLQKQKARLNTEKRKERNGQLIAMGIYVEEYLKHFPQNIPIMIKSMRKLLAGRNQERALAGVNRIVEVLKQAAVSSETALKKSEVERNFSGSPEKEISPEPPSQLPEAVAKEKNQGSA